MIEFTMTGYTGPDSLTEAARYVRRWLNLTDTDVAIRVDKIESARVDASMLGEVPGSISIPGGVTIAGTFHRLHPPPAE